jgi:hypothetical protein
MLSAEDLRDLLRLGAVAAAVIVGVFYLAMALA